MRPRPQPPAVPVLPVLDHNSFPHVVANVQDQSDLAGRMLLGQASSYYNDRVPKDQGAIERQLATHMVLEDMTGGVVIPGMLLPDEHVMFSGETLPARLDLPAAHAAVKIILAVHPESASEPKLVLAKEDESLLAATKILDIRTNRYNFDRYPPLPALAVLKVNGSGSATVPLPKCATVVVYSPSGEVLLSPGNVKRLVFAPGHWTYGLKRITWAGKGKVKEVVVVCEANEVGDSLAAKKLVRGLTSLAKVSAESQVALKRVTVVGVNPTVFVGGVERFMKEEGASLEEDERKAFKSLKRSFSSPAEYAKSLGKEEKRVIFGPSDSMVVSDRMLTHIRSR